MKYFSLFAFLATAFLVAVHATLDHGQAYGGRYVPGMYIIEVSDVKALGGKRSFVSPHEELYDALHKENIAFEVKFEFNCPGIFVGATIWFPYPEVDALTIANNPAVKAIRPVLLIPGPKPQNQAAVESSYNGRLPPDSFSTHVMTGVDKAHAAGYDGRGVKIAIIDTGIDYLHHFLGAGFGPGHKVVGGYDFVGDKYTGNNEPVPDKDPLDNCNGHGTHVAGIIGANPGNPVNIQGVAYGASLAAYRVFGCEGYTTEDIIIQAMMKAVEDHADILTLSIGGVEGWTESSAAVVASRIVHSGKVVTIAAGNDGEYGSWYSSSPGSGINAMSVASVNNIVVPVQNATVKGVNHQPIPYLRANPLNIPGNVRIYVTSTDVNKVDDACQPLPADTPDLSPFVIIIHRGTCTFTQKLSNAAAKGGKKFLIYNSDNGVFSGVVVGNYTAALISAEDGKFLVKEFIKRTPITLSFPQTGAQFNLKDPEGGLVSAFTSYGPTFDMYFKPSVAAPGGNILSTLPRALGLYGLESGTSMATPFVAGSAALLLQKYNKSQAVALGMSDLFETTASNIASSANDNSFLQTVSQQGAGLIQVFKALQAQTIVTPGHLTLNDSDTAYFRGRQIIKIKNNCGKSVTYSLSHIPAGTAKTVLNDGSVSPGPVPLSNEFASVLFGEDHILVPPWQTREVTIRFIQPVVDHNTFPVYSGFIQIKSASETLKVTYLGVAARLKDKKVLDTSNKLFGFPLPALVGASGAPQTGETTYALVNKDVPIVVWRQNFGSPVVRFDLIDKNTGVGSNSISKRDGVGPTWLSWVFGGGSVVSSFDAVPIVGVLAEYDWTPRNSNALTESNNGYNTFVFTGAFANKKQVPNGEYRILLRVLRVTGNRNDENDYEAWISPPFKIARSS